MGRAEGIQVGGNSRSPASLVRRTVWAMVSDALVLAGAVGTFVLLATVLPAEEYGIVGSVQGLAAPALALAMCGAPVMLIRRVSRQHELRGAWSAALAVAVPGGLVAAGVLVVAKPVLLDPAELVPYCLLVVSYVLLPIPLELLYALTIGVQRFEIGTVIRLIGVVPRLAALALFASGGSRSLGVWAWYLLVSNLIALVGGAGVAATLRVGGGRGRAGGGPRRLADAREGFGYALNGVSEGVLEVSDRPIMVNSGFSAEAGWYTLAGRLVTLSLTPSIAIMRATAAQLFRAGEDGTASALAVARRYLPVTLAIGGATTAALWLATPVLSALFPDRLHETLPILRWLAVVPAVKAAQFSGGNVLDAVGRQVTRFWLTMMAAALNLGLNLMLIPRYSWHAAVGTTLTAETLLAFAFWVVVLRLARAERAGRAPLQDPELRSR